MRAVVSGGAGFVGSHLCERLVADGWEVLVLDNLVTGKHENIAHLLGARLSFRLHDVEEPWPDLRGQDVDAVFHLACPASPVAYQRNASKTLLTAVLGTLNAISLACAYDARCVVASTSEVYGDPQENPQREEYWGHVNPVGPRSMYDEGKRAAEALCAAWWALPGVDVRLARIFNTYGPRMARDDGRLLPNLITQALAGAPLTVYGDGSQTRSLCYVTDTVEALMRLSEYTPAARDVMPIFNVGNPDEREIAAIARDVLTLVLAGADPAFAALSGYEYDTEKAKRVAGRIEHRGLPVDDPKRRCPDITRARLHLGNWSPRVGYFEGLKATIEWFKAEGAKR